MLIPLALGQTVKDVVMFWNMSVETLSAAQVRTLIMERIAGDVQDQVVRMDVDQVESREQAPVQPPPLQEADWANSLGYGPQQGAVGKNSKGKGKDDPKGKGKGKDWSKGGPAGAGKGERPFGACSFCLDIWHYYRACPARLGVEGAAQAEKGYVAKGGGELPKGKGKGKCKFGKGKGQGKYGKKGVYGVDEGDEAQWYSSGECAEE